MRSDLFEVVLADPPWRYEHSRSSRRRIENQYPTMSDSEIRRLGRSLPVAEDAVLFLWATMPKLPLALSVIAAWGFTYKTGGIWDKRRVGMGYWFRLSHELILIGTRGKFSPPPPSLRPDSVFAIPRTHHSRKPDFIHEWIERAFPGRRKLELFARRRRPGWAAWGNEVVSDLRIGTKPGWKNRRPAPGGWLRVRNGEADAIVR